jgi:hypothetical protein
MVPLNSLGGGGRSTVNANRSRTHDNAMEWTEMVASGAVVAGISGGGNVDCRCVAGDN